MRTTPSASSSTLASRIAVQIEAEILEGRLRPGDRLDEEAVSSRFGASRTPVRDALRQLAVSGLIEVRPRQSAIVAALTVPRLIEMFEVMADLEGMCARLASRRIDNVQVTVLTMAHQDCEAMLAEGDAVGFYSANTRFHEGIYEAAGNRFLREQTVVLRNRLAPYRRRVTYQPGRMRASIQEHDVILKAIIETRPVAAEQAMRSHVNLLGTGVPDYLSGLDDARGDTAQLVALASNFG